MNKTLKFIKKHDNLIAFVIIVVCVVLTSLYVYEPYDQLYVFGNAYKLSKGKIIYKDVNCIITPIFYVLCKIMLQVFGSNYFIFNLVNILIGISIYFTIYKIQKALRIEKTYAAFNTFLLFVVSYFCINALANYNTLSLEFMLLGLLYTIKNHIKRPKNYELVQSIFIMLTFLTDQKMGARICNRVYYFRKKNQKYSENCSIFNDVDNSFCNNWKI